MKQEKSYTLKFDTFTVEVTLKQIFNIRLRVLRDGTVRLSAPYGATRQRLERFVRERRDWVEDQLRSVTQDPVQQEGELISGDTLTVFGFPYTIRLLPAACFSLKLTAGEALFSCPAGSTAEQRQAYLDKWQRMLLKTIIDDHLPRWEEITGLRCAGYQIRDMSSRWGSCTVKTGKLRFNLQLIRYPLPCLDYVILHELCHLAVPNHSADFKALLSRHMPDWKEWKNLLRG